MASNAVVSTLYSGLGLEEQGLSVFGLSHRQLRGFRNLLLVVISHFSSGVQSQVLVRKGQSGLGKGDGVAWTAQNVPQSQ